MSIIDGEDNLSGNIFAISTPSGIEIKIDYYNKVLSAVIPYEEVQFVIDKLLKLQQEGASCQ
jgi:hypothetical protein